MLSSLECCSNCFEDLLGGFGGTYFLFSLDSDSDPDDFSFWSDSTGNWRTLAVLLVIVLIPAKLPSLKVNIEIDPLLRCTWTLFPEIRLIGIPKIKENHIKK